MRFVLLCICSCLFLSISSRSVYANTDEELTSNNNIIEYNDFIFIDPNTPSLLDEEVIDTSKCKVTSAFFYNGQYHWNNFATAYYDVPNSVGSFVVFYQLPTSIEKGTYNITIEYQTDNNITLNFANVVFQDKTGYQFQDAITGEVIQTIGNRITLQFKNIEIKSDAYTMSFNLGGTLQPSGSSSTTHLRLYTDKLTFEKKDDTKSLLDGIIGWIKNIYNGIVDLPSNIANNISGFFTWIVNAVNEMKNTVVNALTTLGNFLIEGIKGLFVPSTEQLQEYSNKWDTLIKERFGALYDCVTIVKEFTTNISYSGNQSIIEFPSVTVNLADVPFTYGGWSVQVIPEGFGFIVSSIKFVVNVACTLLFVNAMRNRFERLLGGQE